MAKKSRKFVGTLVAIALGASTLIAASPVQAVQALNATVSTPVGLRAGIWYDGELYNDRGSFDSDATFIQGSITGADAASTDLVGVQLKDANFSDSNNDIEDTFLYDADQNDELYVDNSGTEFSVHSYNGSFDSVYFDYAGTYEFELTFYNDDEDTTFTKTATVTVGGVPVSATLENDSTIIPVITDDYDSYSYRTLTYFDVDGIQTSLEYDDEFDMYDTADDMDWSSIGDHNNNTDQDIFMDGEGYFTNGTYEVEIWNWYEDTDQLWVRTYINESDDDFDTDSVSLNTREWVNPSTLDDDGVVTVASANGVAAATDCGFTTCDNWADYVWIRDGLDSLTLQYNGGSDNADKFVELYLYDSDGLNYSDEDALLLTDANGHAEVTFDLGSVDAGDDVQGEAQSFDWNDSATSDVLNIVVEASGFMPRYNLQDVSQFSETIWENHDLPYYSDQYSKSVTPGDEMSLSYKAVDVFGDSVANLRTDFGSDCGPFFCGDFSVADDDKFTNASGVVTFDVTNEVTMAELDELDATCAFNAINCQDAYSSLEAHMENIFYAETHYGGWSSSDVLLVSTVRSTDVADMGLYFDGSNGEIDTLGNTSDDNVAISVTPTNEDGIKLFGISASIEASEGAYVFANGICVWWGCTLGNPGDDVTADGWVQSSDYTVGTWFGNWEDSGAYGWVGTGTLNGTATWTITVGDMTETRTQDYHNDYQDARYIELVNTASANVLSGKVTTLQYVITDRFGNTVEGQNVYFEKAGLVEFTSSDPYTSSDENGLVSVDVVTPANTQGSSVVTAGFDDWNYASEDLSDYGVSDGNDTATTTVSYAYKIPKIIVKKWNKGVTVIVKNATNNFVRIYLDGKSVKRFVPVTSNAIRKIAHLKPGKHKIVIKVKGVTGLVTKTVTLKIKKK
jgi:hypothetical protein